MLQFAENLSYLSSIMPSKHKNSIQSSLQPVISCRFGASWICIFLCPHGQHIIHYNLNSVRITYWDIGDEKERPSKNWKCKKKIISGYGAVFHDRFLCQLRLCWAVHTFNSEDGQCNIVRMSKTLRVVTMNSLCAWSKEFTCFWCVFGSFGEYLLCSVVVVVVCFGEGLGGHFLFLLLFLSLFFLMLCCILFCFILFVVKLCFRFGIVSLPQNKFSVSFQKRCFGIANCGKFESGCWNTQTLCKLPFAGRSCLVSPKTLLAWLHSVSDWRGGWSQYFPVTQWAHCGFKFGSSGKLLFLILGRFGNLSFWFISGKMLLMQHRGKRSCKQFSFSCVGLVNQQTL